MMPKTLIIDFEPILPQLFATIDELSGLPDYRTHILPNYRYILDMVLFNLCEFHGTAENSIGYVTSRCLECFWENLEVQDDIDDAILTEAIVNEGQFYFVIQKLVTQIGQFLIQTQLLKSEEVFPFLFTQADKYYRCVVFDNNNY